jgi:hypothetical protein
LIRCLFKRSDMTPCVIEDGAVCYSAGPPIESTGPVCVGCERSVEDVNYDLNARGHDPIYPDDSSKHKRRH